MKSLVAIPVLISLMAPSNAQPDANEIETGLPGPILIKKGATYPVSRFLRHRVMMSKDEGQQFDKLLRTNPTDRDDEKWTTFLNEGAARWRRFYYLSQLKERSTTEAAEFDSMNSLKKENCRLLDIEEKVN